MLVNANINKPGHQQPDQQHKRKPACALLFACLLITLNGIASAQDTLLAPTDTQETQQQTEPNPASSQNEPESDSDQPADESTAPDTLPQDSADSETPENESTDEDATAAPEVSDDQAEDTQPGQEPEPGPARSDDPESACDRISDLEEKESTWYDSAHAVMNTAFCEPAVWFDDFFASDRIFEEVAGTYVRWRNDVFFHQEDGFDFNTNLNFSIELPKISSKIKLIFEGDQDQALQDVLPRDQTDATSNTLGLRVDVKETSRSRFNISFSAKPRVRMRYRYTFPIRDDFLIRFTQEVQNEEGVNGARTRLDFEKAFLPLKLFRSTTEFFYAEDFPGTDWAQGFALFKRITRRSSISYETSAVGITRPQSLVTNYRIGVRYRQNIHRDYLFLEISPDITWPIDLSEDRETILKERRSVYALLVRLEVHFGNAARRKYSDYY